MFVVLLNFIQIRGGIYSMAHQPTKSRKFLAGTVTAALVATAIVPTASAAEFSDIAGNTHEDAINALVDLGVINGYPDGTFQPNKTLSRSDVVKMMGKWLVTLGYEVPADYASVQRFDDVSLTGNQELLKYAALVKDTGVFNGSEGKLDPTGSITRENMALVLVRAFDEINGTDLVAHVEGEEFDQEVTDLSSAKAEARPFINVLDFYDITSVSEFMPKSTVTRGQFATFLYKTSKVEAPVDSVEVASVSAITAKSLEVEFNKAVDTDKANITLKKGTNTVSVASVTWSEDKKTATVELSSKLYAGTYDVTVSGLSDEAITKSVTVESEKVASIEILTDKGILVDGNDGDTDAGDAIEAGYIVKNQYGEDITRTTSLQTSTNAAGTVALNNGTATIDLTSGNFTVDSKVVLTLIHAETATTATATLTVSAEAKVSDVTVKALYNEDDATLSEDSADANDFMLVVEAKDQYGRVITDSTKLDNELLVSVSNPGVVSVFGLSGNNADFENVTIDGVSKTVLKLDGTLVKGTSVITLISSATGKNTAYSVNVAEGLTMDTIVLGDVSLVAADETVKVPVTVTDKNGNVVTNLTAVQTGVTVTTTSPGNFVKENGNIFYQFTAPASAGTVTLTAVTETSKVAVKTIDIKAKAVPTVITGIDSSVNKLIYDGELVSIANNKFVVEDQYGRVMSDANFVSTLDNDITPAAGEYQVVVTEANAAGGAVSASGTTIDANAATDSVEVTGLAKGSESLTFKLQKYTTSWVDVNASQFSTSFRTVEQSEIVSYGVEDLSKIYANANYTSDLVVYGLTADNKKVELPTSEYNVVVNNGVTVSGATLDASGVSFGAGVTEVSAKATVTINDTGDVVEKDFVVTNVAPKVEVLEVQESGAAVAALTLSAATVSTTFEADDIAEYLYVEDQYGEDAAVSGTTGVVTFDDTVTTATPTFTVSSLVDAAASDAVITNNGLNTATITNVAVGDSFNLTVKIGGKVTTVKVTLD